MAQNILYNVQTGEPENLPVESIQDAIVSGTHAFKKGERVNVIGEDGKSQSLPTEQLSQAFQQGFRLETPTEGAINDYVDDNKGFGGTLKAFGSKALSEVAYGVPELIYEKTGDPLEIAKFEALKKDHEIATALGALTGFGASVFGGGPVVKGAAKAGNFAQKIVANRLKAAGVKGSEGLAKRMATSIAEKSARIGAEGATFAAPRAITEAALGDPEAAAESLIWGVGLGAGLGAGMGTLAPAVQKLSKAQKEVGLLGARSGGVLRNFRNERAAKALGFSKSQIKKVGGQEQAAQIGEDILNARMPDGQKIIGPYDSTEKIAQKLYEYQRNLGNDIAKVYKEIDDSGTNFFDANKVKNRIQSELGEFYRSPLNKSEAKLFDNLLETVSGKGEKISLREAKEILDLVDNVAYPKGQRPISPNEKQLLAQDARRIIREELNSAAEVGARSIGDESLAKTLVDSNKKISSAIKAKRAIQDKISSEQGNRYFGLTDVITGAGVGGIDPVAGVATVGLKKIAEKYGNQFLANLDVGGLLLAERAMKRAASEMDRIPEIVKNIGQAGKKAASVGGLLTLTRLYGEDVPPSEVAKRQKEELLKELSKKSSLIVSNPDRAMDEIIEMTAPINQGGAPEVSAMMADKISKIRKYIFDSIPRPITPSNPFIVDSWKPSSMQMQSFEDKLDTVQNPFSVLDRLADGTLTKDHVEALAVNFPKIYNLMKDRIIDAATEDPSSLSYQARLKLSLLLGADLDPSLSPQFLQVLRVANESINQQAAKPIPQSKASALTLAERTAQMK